MYVALVVALVALVLFTAFNVKVRNSVIWLSKKTLAVLIIAFLSIALALLAVQVAIVSLALVVVCGLSGIVFWTLSKLSGFGAKWSEKGYLFGLDFSDSSFKTIGSTIVAKAKSVWKRWS